MSGPFESASYKLACICVVVQLLGMFTRVFTSILVILIDSSVYSVSH